MFASCGDDGTIRIWASEPTAADPMDVAFDSLSTGPAEGSVDVRPMEENGAGSSGTIGSNGAGSGNGSRPQTATARTTLGSLSMSMMAVRESPR